MGRTLFKKMIFGWFSVVAGLVGQGKVRFCVAIDTVSLDLIIVNIGTCKLNG